MKNLREFIKFKIRKILNESLSVHDYSGEYYSLYDFIYDNDLQHAFVDKYSKFDPDLTINNWEDFVNGEMGDDEEIIKDFLGSVYKIHYDIDEDIFTVTKKKSRKINYTIIQSNSTEIFHVLDDVGIYSEYDPRFAVMLNTKIIGGSTYEIDDDNIYNFDVGVLDEYQGYGISKQLIDKIILDAKHLKCNGLKAHVVNDILFDYLITHGFDSSIDSGMKYVYMSF